MSVLQVNNIWKQFTGEYILKDINATIEDNDKIGLVGLNGTGKSTLIKIILGEETIDEDEKNEVGVVTKSQHKKIGYLSQNHNLNENNTVYEEMKDVFKEEFEIWDKMQVVIHHIAVADDAEKERLLEELAVLTEDFEKKDGYEIEYKIKRILTGLELNEKHQHMQIKNLSGGEKTRVSIAKLLLQNPDLLILDEPTNHLDLMSIEWLEGYLKKYSGAFLLVSHDRTFLENVCNKIYEIENKKLYKYNGNFSQFVLQKELMLKGELKRYDKEQEKIKKTEEYIEKYKAGIKSKQARGRQKILDRLERMDDPIFNPKRMRLKFTSEHPSADKVLTVKNINKSFDGKRILKDISFDIYKGERIGVVGKNGTGKSTLLKIIMDKIKPDSGVVEFGTRVKEAYYDQDHSELFDDNQIIQEINTSLDLTEEYLRSLAGGFLFSGDDILKKISSLSGGEKVRVSLLKLLLKKSNFLILDEPTNHLDIYSIEVLEQALEDFEGTILMVSHNRYFLNSICNMIYHIDEDGIEKVKGNYDDYVNRVKDKEEEKKNAQEVGTNSKLDYQEQKKYNSMINKIKKDIEKLEKNIESIYEKKAQINKDMLKHGGKNDVGALIDLQNGLDELSKEEDEKIEQLTELEIELEEKETLCY